MRGKGFAMRLVIGLALVKGVQGAAHEGAEGLGLEETIDMAANLQGGVAMALGAVGWAGQKFNKSRGLSGGKFLRVAGFNVAKKLVGGAAELREDALHKGLDILVLTETGVLKKDLGWVEGVFSGFKMFSIPASNARAHVEGGLIMLVRCGSNLQVEAVKADEKEGRWLSLKVALGGPHTAWVHGGYGVSGGGQLKVQKETRGGGGSKLGWEGA
jgi:hypothetical protein